MITAFIDAVLVDGKGNPPIKDAVVLIEDGMIIAAGHRDQIPVPEHAQQIHLGGKTILPGLIDCHIHLDLHGYADTYDENLIEDKVRCLRAAKEMRDTLRKGITTVRNVGSVNHIDFAVKEAIQKGFCEGPRILASGRIISMTASGNDYFLGLYREADGPDEVRKAAREQLKAGADVLKVMATGAVMNPGGVPGAPQLNLEEIRAVVEEGAKLGIRTAAHAHGAEGIKNAILAGVTTIEHGTFMTNEVIELMVKHGVYLVPTYVVDYLMLQAGEQGGVPVFMIEKIKGVQKHFIQQLDKAIKAGVRVAFGTDAGTNYNYHGNNALELMLLVKDGFMTPLEAIHSATEVSAQAIGLENKIGSIEEGKIADLIVVNGSIEKDLTSLVNGPEMVFKSGNMCHGDGGSMCHGDGGSDNFFRSTPK